MQEVGPVVWVGGEWVWSPKLNDWVYVPVLKPIPNPD